MPIGEVRKTCRRTVVNLQFGRFEAREIIRQRPHQDGLQVQRSGELPKLVPRGARYGFDLIAHVGVETYLRGVNLQDLREELKQRSPALDIPLSSLWDQQQKFLFYLGHLHQQAAPRIATYLTEHGPVTWLLDGTIEPGTPVLFGIQEATFGIALASWKIPSENIDDIVPCLQQGLRDYGRPDRLLHDLSRTISAACDQALQGVPHGVCHYHLASDVGEDLYREPQNALAKRMRALKVQYRLRQQRRGQSEWFREQPDPTARRLLKMLLAGQPVDAPFSDALGREVLLAFHFWILDYKNDGRRRGFPFDPYTLYLHRRLVCAGEGVDALLSVPSVARQAPPVLLNFQQHLRAYRQDHQIQSAAEAYERAHSVFSRFRETLHLTSAEMSNLRQVQDLSVDEQQDMKSSLEHLREDLAAQAKDPQDIDRSLAKVVLAHIEKYWSGLVLETPTGSGVWDRTTSQLESLWRGLKRRRRRSHGRGKLTRDFQAIPAEYMLVSNLENPTYVELVLDGNLATLPSKLANAAANAGSFQAWKRQQLPELVGQLPRNVLRNDDFIDGLIGACHRHCKTVSRNQVRHTA